MAGHVNQSCDPGTKYDLASANDFMEKAGDMADEVKSEFVG